MRKERKETVAAVGRPVEPNGGSKYVLDFWERRKRKYFVNFGVETEVDE